MFKVNKALTHLDTPDILLKGCKTACPADCVHDGNWIFQDSKSRMFGKDETMTISCHPSKQTINSVRLNMIYSINVK